MKKLVTVCLSLALSITAVPRTGRAEESPAERDKRMAWFREARFGMFIHWGVYSVPAGTYQGKPVKDIGEWIMHHGKIPVAEYRQFARQFNPVKYNADEWVRTAKDAGAKYIVITSKHHDGFAMFDSKASDWNIVKASPFGRDPLKELAAACKKHGMRLGFYYSQAQDWNNPGGAASGGHWDKAQDGDMTEYIRKVAAPQVREILSNYGRVSILWWDTPHDMTKERADLLLPLLSLQPGIIYNDRLGGGYRGDTNTPEQFIPATGYPGRDWETCMTMNDTWGYKSYDNNWKSPETLIRQLVEASSKGGNYLLNVGPTSEGLIPPPSVERLKAIGTWLKTNGTAIYGTTASPFKRLPWGRATTKVTPGGTTLYLHVFDWPKDGKLVVPGLRNKVKTAALLTAAGHGKKGAKQNVAAEARPEGLTLSLPAAAPDPISSSVVLTLTGPLQIDPVGIFQDFDGSAFLEASEARLHGSAIKHETAERRGTGLSDCGGDHIGQWTNPEDSIDWELKVSKPGKFQVSAELAALVPAQLEVSVGASKVQGLSPTTKTWEQFKTAKLGIIEVAAPGTVSISVRPVKDGWHPIALKTLLLKPAK